MGLSPLGLDMPQQILWRICTYSTSPSWLPVTIPRVGIGLFRTGPATSLSYTWLLNLSSYQTASPGDMPCNETHQCLRPSPDMLR